MALAAVYDADAAAEASAAAWCRPAELLMVSYGARQHIRKNALQHLHQEITITRKLGSFTLEESLAQLVRDGLIERADALARAVHPDEIAPDARGSGREVGPVLADELHHRGGLRHVLRRGSGSSASRCVRTSAGRRALRPAGSS